MTYKAMVMDTIIIKVVFQVEQDCVSCEIQRQPMTSIVEQLIFMIGYAVGNQEMT